MTLSFHRKTKPSLLKYRSSEAFILITVSIAVFTVMLLFRPRGKELVPLIFGILGYLPLRPDHSRHAFCSRVTGQRSTVQR
jgi:hypothetical protein